MANKRMEEQRKEMNQSRVISRVNKELDKHFKEWVGMEDYYTRNFIRIHKLVSNARRYIQDKLEQAKFDGADINFIKQLEAEYYALEVIWVNMNEVETNRPRLEKNS